MIRSRGIGRAFAEAYVRDEAGGGECDVDQTSCPAERWCRSGSSLDAWQPANPGGSGADVRASEIAQLSAATPYEKRSGDYSAKKDRMSEQSWQKISGPVSA